MDAAAKWAERLSVAAEAVAHAFEVAKEDTPTPDEFTDAESDVVAAGALMAISPVIGMIQYERATERYAELYKKAETAAAQYHSSVSAALTDVGDPMVPCPAIASEADIPKIPVGPVRSGEVPPDVQYLAGQIPEAPAGPPVTIGKTTKQTFFINDRQYIGGDPFENNFNNLPQVDSSGSPIAYREYDRAPYTPGVPRNSDRIVMGTDGSRYFTSDHYKTFTKF
ncbi:hypothetical protein ASD37_08120 [Mycobacterium sp. Root135]|uniref:ribonuclease domain-containing protein n=1 Tax=Mycobacterium sp. Root135 TaxID=1736457 RepID=UPI0006F35893|nr:ribonuclease domain-containing protein [Mycobacterium sp. Root135]KQY07933.1 hypothetical protein ASD37_08120 [Mycobacterium sp. Root135]